MNRQNADDLAHTRFKADFNKLFGAAPSLRKSGPIVDAARLKTLAKLFPADALRKEYHGADEFGRTLMLLEVMLEKLAEPARLEKRAALAKLAADQRAVRVELTRVQAEISKVTGQIEDMRKRQEVADRGAFKFQPFAIDSRNPPVAEIIGNAVRADPNVVGKIN